MSKYEITLHPEGLALYGTNTPTRRLELTVQEARRLASDLMMAAADVEEIQQGQEQMA